MCKKNLKVIISFVLCLAVLFTVMVPAFAASNELQAQQAAAKEYQEKHQELKDAIQKLTNHVKRLDDGTFELVIPKNLQKEIDSEILKNIIAGMTEINSLIKVGKLQSTENLTVYDPTNTNFSIQGNLNGVIFTWYGFDLYMDNSHTQQLIALIAGGASATTIAAAIAGIIPGGQLTSGLLWIATGIMGLGGAILAYNNASGNGVMISFLGIVDPVPFWICSQ